MEEVNEKTLQTTKKYKGIFIAQLIILVLITAFLVYGFIDVVVDPDETSRAIGIVFYLTIFLVFCGGIGYVVSMILGVIGLVLSVKAKKQGLAETKTMVKFIVTTALPVVIWLALYIACYAIA